MSAAAMSDYTAPRLSRQGLVVVVALHGAALWALAQMELISLPAPLAVLSVSLLPAAETPPQPPAVEPPRPRPVAKKPPPPVAQPTPLALPVEAPVVPVFEAPAPPPVEAPPPPPAAVAPTPRPAPPPMAEPTPPRFDANYRDNPKPAYPALSRRLGEEGRVVLRVRVGPDGLPLAVELHTSSGSTRLDATAIDTVRRWKFVPARRGSEAIAASVLVPIVFSLKE